MLWLNKFVLPHDKLTIRLETFYMASLMASGIRVSFALSALGHIYHGLSVSTTDKIRIGYPITLFPMHYMIGWIAEYSPRLYHGFAPDETLTDSHLLCKYARTPTQEKTSTKVESIFREDQYVCYCPYTFPLLDDAY